MSGKRAKQNRREGVDRRQRARQLRKEKSDRLHLKAVEEAKKAGKIGEDIDIQVIIDGMSDAERLTMKGAVAPAPLVFQRLMEKGLCKLVEDDNGIRQLIPTKLGFVVADILHGRLVIKDSKIEVVNYP